MKLAAVTALATGFVFAQTPPPSPSPNQPAGRHQGARRHRARLAQALNLTDAQKAQAKTIFQQARESAKPVREELKENREALAAAVKAGKKDADLQKLAMEQGKLRGQMVAIRTEAFAKFYQTLTPEQRTKADRMRSRSERKNG
jgi:Spy/CpxP family protein refolding chaperone